MPGAFAHITLVNVTRETQRLRGFGLSNAGSGALLDYLGHGELGAVSPDYPYLAVADGNAAKWADLMHYERTGDVLRAATDGVRALHGEPRRRAFAWLLGYAAHVATDVTIHPVVELKVGPYAQNKTAHRVCEMYQDAYIYAKLMNLGEVGLSEHLKSGILRCTQPGNPQAVDDAVKGAWEAALRAVHAGEAAANAPQVDHWHRSFALMVDKIGEEGNKLMPIARHVAVNCGLTYPSLASVQEKKSEYIENLAVPGGARQHYDQIFERAIGSVGRVWQALDRAVWGNDPAALAFIGAWNLDTGKDQATNKLVFWA